MNSLFDACLNYTNKGITSKEIASELNIPVVRLIDEIYHEKIKPEAIYQATDRILSQRNRDKKQGDKI